MLRCCTTMHYEDMPDFRRTTAATLTTDLRAFADEIDRRRWPVALRDREAVWLNEHLDALLRQDAFGTEGQCDPRGDDRE